MGKKRVGIVTIFDVVGNYGNKLQNYAVVTILEKCNYEVETIVVEKQRPFFILKGACIANRIFKYRLSKGQIGWLKSLGTRRFDRKYLNPTYSLLKGKDISEDYDYFVVGSDQVWNPHWYDELKKEVFLLSFAKAQKRISIAASFGVSKLPDEWKPWFKEHLQEFRAISVREKDGANIVSELIGKEATVLIDPTLMLDAAEWHKISEKPKNVQFNNSYIFTYFLGGQSDRVKEDIKIYCEKYGLREYNLQRLNGHHPYASNPGQFIYMIEHASLILTDSFHACVFSFLFSKPFLVYERMGINMMSRIETLLKKFSLQRKFVNSGLQNELFECDYGNGFKQLEIERKKFMEFLEHSFKL